MRPREDEALLRDMLDFASRATEAIEGRTRSEAGKPCRSGEC
jgi:hypothetical protein